MAHRTILRFLTAPLLVAVAALPFTLTPAHAGVVFSNGSPDPTSGLELTGWIEANSFSLAADTTISDVHFQAHMADSGGIYNGSILWFIYADNAGSPGATLSSGSANVPLVLIGPGAAGYTDYELDFFIDPFLATAGTTYWLGLHNGDLTNQSPSLFYWGSATGASTPDASGLIAPFTGSWSSIGVKTFFELTDDAAVPEPSSLALLGAGLLLVWCAKRSLNSRPPQ